MFVGGSGPYLGILLGTLGVAAVGLVDDVRGLRPRAKLLAVAVIASSRCSASGSKLDHLTLPIIGDHDLGAAAYPLTVAWITALANLVNLIDGIDALASGIVAIAALAFALLAASFAHTDAAVLSAIVCGATLAFLRHNYHPARIFMGDTGALALGFLLAALSVEGLLKTAAAVTLVAPLLVLAVPILDTSFVVLKRLKYRRPPWDADHNHFYHRFLRIGLTQRRTALTSTPGRRCSPPTRFSSASFSCARRATSTPATRPFSPRPDCSLWRPRYGWSTRWRSSSFGTCRFCA